MTLMFRPRGSAKAIPFRLTARRKEILWHIAYTYEVRIVMRPDFARRFVQDRVPVFHLGQINIHEIVIILKRAKLVDFHLGAPGAHLRITPLGMQVLLDGET